MWLTSNCRRILDLGFRSQLANGVLGQKNTPRQNGSCCLQLDVTGLFGSLISGLKVATEWVFSWLPAEKGCRATGVSLCQVKFGRSHFRDANLEEHVR